MENAPKLTPMMAQYSAVKSQYPDTLVMMRMGDFYEMIGEDAERGLGTAAKLCNRKSRLA